MSTGTPLDGLDGLYRKTRAECRSCNRFAQAMRAPNQVYQGTQDCGSLDIRPRPSPRGLLYAPTNSFFSLGSYSTM